MASFLSPLTGSFSQPAADNPTVAMMEAAYRAAGLDFRYLNCDVAPADLAAAVAGAKAMGWVGFNCSLPHKTAVIAHLDELGESARHIGAVNCAVKRDGRWLGENTDGRGFLESLRPYLDPAGKNIVILGAGGAARAIAVELALAGTAAVTIVNRSIPRAQELLLTLAPLVDDVFFEEWTGPYQVPVGTDVLINATSLGLAPHGQDDFPLDFTTLTSATLVADVIPNPPQTRFLREAAARGCTLLDGLTMLINQGALNFTYWTGEAPDKLVMREVLEGIFAQS